MPFLVLVLKVVPYIGTWIETAVMKRLKDAGLVVPYIGTWIETAYPFRAYEAI